MDPRPDRIQPFDEFYEELQNAQHEHYRNRKETRSRGAAAFEEQKRHLVELYNGVHVGHSFVDSAGQVFDCIPVADQPALRGRTLAKVPTLPLIKATAVAAPENAPPGIRTGQRDTLGNDMTCPPGTVPIRRITLSELTQFETLGHFLRKGGHPKRRTARAVVVPADAGGAPHEYAHASQAVPNVGGHSVLGVWDPSISTGQLFSLSQHWYIAETAGGDAQTVEVGWQVYPGMYQHAKPVLFTYWTADGYTNTGSYNNTAGDFVQVSPTMSAGMALETWSQCGGVQVEMELTVMLESGNWWIFVNGNDAVHALGYYPTSLYQGGPLATRATSVDYGGETVGSSSYPAMGSGEFAARGYKFAAYHRNIHYFSSESTSVDAVLTASQDWPNSYTIDVESSSDWGEYFYYGGPGGSTSPPLPPSVSTGSRGTLSLYGPHGMRVDGLTLDDVAAILKRL
jgi:hypothetical protein